MEKQNENKEKDLTGALFASPTPGEISIVCISPWDTANHPNSQNEFISIFNQILECGFNMIMITQDLITDMAVSAATNVGLKVIIQRNSDPKRDIVQCAIKYKNNFMVPIFELWDEPSYNDLTTEDYIDLYQTVKSYAPSKGLYFNLASNFANTDYNWNSRLNWVFINYNPTIWSFDFYPLIIKNGVTINHCRALFDYLKIFSSISQSTGKPFWSNVICTEYYIPEDYSRPYPTEQQMRCATFAALAMGAQGISFWHYTNREPDPRTGEIYTNSPIKDRVKTPIWYSLQNVISEIKKYSYIFVNCILDYSHMSATNSLISISTGPLNTIVSNSDNVIITQVHVDKIYYVVMVNMSVEFSATLTLNFYRDYMQKYMWNKVTSNVPSSMGPTLNPEESQFVKKVVIEPGDYAILYWK